WTSIEGLHVENCQYGVHVYLSSGSQIVSATFDSVQTGIYVQSSAQVNITGSDFTGCTVYGALFNGSTEAIVYSNTFKSLPNALGFISNSDNATITNNYFQDSTIYFDSTSDDSTVYFNLFRGITTYLTDQGTGNAMNNGTHGNLYLDYTGHDYDNDLIGDTPYSDRGVTDNYPLMVWGSWPSNAWDVRVDTYALAINYTMNGDITIHDSVAFYLYNAVIWFNCTADREYGLYFNSGSSLTYTDGGLRAYNVTHRFEVVTHETSSITMHGTLLDGCYHILIVTNSTSLDSLTITNTYNGISLDGTNLYGIDIGSVDITGAENTGYVITQASHITIHDGTVTDAPYGISILSGTSDIVIDHMTLSTIQNMALHLEYTTNVTIQDVQVSTAQYGVYIDTHVSGYVHVLSSTFDHLQYGVACHANTPLTELFVSDTSMSSVTAYGLDVFGVANFTVIDCTINPHGGRMINLGASVDWFKLQHLTGFNGSYGVYFSIPPAGIITDSEFRNFTDAAIFLPDWATGMINITISDSHFYGCHQGIDASGDIVRIIHNVFEYGVDAVYVGKATFIVFANNTISHINNAFYGGSYTARVSLSGNVYTDLTSDAIYLQMGNAGSSVYNETITGCRYGLILSTANVTIDHVVIRNADYGIHLSGSQSVNISNVQISDSDGGIYLSQSTGCRIRTTSIENTSQGIETYIVNKDEGNHDIDTSNTYEGKPLYYIFNQNHTVYTGIDTNHLSLVYCNYVTITDSSFAGDTLDLVGLQNCVVANSTIATSISSREVDNTLIKANIFDASQVIRIRNWNNYPTNVTFTLNSFLSEVLFTGNYEFNLNASDYGNYWTDNPDTTDANHDGIGDVPYHTNSPIDYLPLVVAPKKYNAYPVIQTPSNNDHVGNNVFASINSSITVGVLYEGTPTTVVTLDLNGTNIYSGGLGYAEFTFDATPFTDGYYVLRMRVLVDGTDEFVTSIDIWIDNTAPVITDNLVDGHVFITGSTTIDVSSSDASSTVAWIAIIMNGTLQTNQTGSPLWYSLTFSDEGLYIINITVSDSVGNIATVLKTVYYDHTAPELVGPSGSVTYEEGTTGNTVTIHATD
ncbi:MAG: right-handed parallel beta-helix repeat-containing protein, partial [Candidatus Thorarchaeota archaeon]